MKMDDDFIVTDSEVRYRDLDVVATIKITRGEYKDVEFYFGSVYIPDKENDDGTFTLSFDYDIISKHTHFKKNKEFESVLSQIMNSIFRYTIEEAERKYKNEFREENT
jgi:hypothetical protein